MPFVEDFVHLRLYSEYDVQKGIARLSKNGGVVSQAARERQPALALTDTDCLSGAVKFFDSCQSNGIKPIIGCEIKVSEQDYLLVLCASEKGYHNLNRLLSKAQFEKGMVLPTWMNEKTTEGLIALSGGKRGDVGKALLRQRDSLAVKMAHQWHQRFPNRYYLEVWQSSPEDSGLTEITVDIATQANLPVVASHPIQCTHPEDIETLDVRMCIAQRYRLDSPLRSVPLAKAPYLLSTKEMNTIFSRFPEALKNSVEIAKRCNFEFNFTQKHMPLWSAKKEQSVTELRALAKQGLQEKLLENKSSDSASKYQSRLEYELKVIIDTDFVDYFLIVRDFIIWSKTNDIPVGPGRGSGSGSLVAYALGITALDPIHFGLLFERFLNPDRVSMPDFDIDFCVLGRDRVIEYVADKYGVDHVSQIVTFGTIGARAAIRDIGRVLGMPYNYCNRIAKNIPGGAIKVSLEQALKDSKELALEQENEEGRRLLELALKVENLPRHAGTHAGGVLITPQALQMYCPLYKLDSQFAISQFDMEAIEKIGLVKFDFLGLRTLTILKHAETHLLRTKIVAPDFSLETIDLNVPEVYQLYSNANTIGVFQCESDGMRELMRQLRPDRFQDVIALMALYRPGPLNSGVVDSYILRKHGKEEIAYPHPVMEQALGETYGICVYQEQVMEVARLIAGYSLGEADLLRRAMGKKKEDEMATQRDRFIEGAKDKLSAKQAGTLFDNIESFAGYGFNKSHAAAYALLSYRTAYLKHFYPAAFFAAILTAESSNTDRVKILVEDARKQKIEISPPNINLSKEDFQAEGKQEIRYGLSAVKGVGTEAASQIVSLRQNKKFVDIFDFCARTKEFLSVAAMDALAKAGAFDSLHSNRAEVTNTIPAAILDTVSEREGLFSDRPLLTPTTAWSGTVCLSYEKQVLGFPFSNSFYSLHNWLLEKLPLNPKSMSDLSANDAGKKVCLAGLVTRVIENKNMIKKGFALFTLADDQGAQINVLASSENIQKLKKESLEEFVWLVEGEVQANGRHRSTLIRSRQIMRLDHFVEHRLWQLTIHCRDAKALETIRAQFSPQVNGEQGCEWVLHYKDEKVSYSISLGRGKNTQLPMLEALAGSGDILYYACTFNDTERRC